MKPPNPDQIDQEWAAYSKSTEAAFTRLHHAWGELKRVVLEEVIEPIVNPVIEALSSQDEDGTPT